MSEIFKQIRAGDIVDTQVMPQKLVEVMNYLSMEYPDGYDNWFVRGVSNAILGSSPPQAEANVFDSGFQIALDSVGTQKNAIRYLVGGILGAALAGVPAARALVEKYAPKMSLSSKDVIGEIGREYRGMLTDGPVNLRLGLT